MKVWIVSESILHEGLLTPAAVFSTEEGAKSYVEKHPLHDRDWWEITSLIVDEDLNG